MSDRQVPGLWVRRLARLCRMDVWIISLRELIQAQPPQLTDGVDVTFKVLTEAEIRDIAGNHPEMSESFVSEALQRGDQCLAAWLDGRIVGLTWRAMSRVTVTPGLDLLLRREHTFVGFKTWVDDSVRGMRLFAAMRYAFDDAFMQAGRSQGLSYVHVDNAASLKSLYRDPAVATIGWVVHARWGPFGWASASSGAKPWLQLIVKR